ncbi:MAG: Ig-like domain-containing protein [Butyrivibrio sp.]|nr:GH25 family lysozyme [Butyrivibrio sp.]MBR1641517.1 Ig-like domain-containing protein [Butyrivibrio sp.]
MKKSLNLFNRKKPRRRQREDDFIDYDEQYNDEDYDEGYDDEDYPDEEFEEEYGDEVDDRFEDDDYPEDDRYEDDDSSEDDERYEDEDYPEEDDRYEDDDYPEEDDRYEDDEYPEDDRYEEDDYPEDDYDRDYEDEDDYDRDYEEDEDYDQDYEDEYDRDRGAYAGRGGRDGRRNRGSRRGRDRDDYESVGARILEFLANTSVAERAAVVVAVLLLAGGIAFMAFYSKAKNYAAEVGSFAEVGADLQVDGVVGSSGLLAIADAEMARAMAAGMVEEIEEEEEEVPDTASNVTIKMTLTSIKSDMKIKFINSETKKLVANVPFVVSVVTPDGTKISYDDHDRDGIIYKKDLTAGKYKITPEALSSEYENYKLDTSTQTLTVKDTVEMKAVDVSNEIKKESQVNAAKEDTAVETQVESVLNDTVEWVDSNQNSSTSSDGKYKYEVIDKNDIPDPSSSAKLTLGSVRRMAAARARTGNEGGDANLPTTDPAADASTAGTSEEKSDGSSDASTAGTTEAGSEASTVEPEKPKDMSVSLTESSIKVGQTTTINVSGPSGYNVSSDNESVATASGNTVTAKSAGTAKITVKADGYNDASVSITVNEADKKNMTLSATSLSIKMGENGKITVSSGPSSFNVKSSDEKIAKVASDGTITPVAEGSATITFSADGYNDATATVTVGKADKKDMTLSVKELTIAINEKGKITISSGPSSFTIKSSDEKIAKVASDGTITGVAEGKATITFSADGYNDAAATVTVTKTGTKELVMNVKKVTLVQGQTFKISPKETSLTVTYKSDNTDIATISGVTITGVKEGKTSITCSCTGYADTKIEITVVSKTTVLKDRNGNVVYVKDSNGNYVEATYNDYYNGSTFYLKKENDGVRQGWWTIDGKTYYYNKNGDKVTGEQVIKGAKYSFGSDGALSSSSGTMGIDVSKWNGNINWTQVKNAGVNYAIIRCGYRGSSAGALIEDPKFRANIQGAQAAGIRVGVYFFSQAVNEVEAVEEASMCINLCKGYNLSFPIYIDVEASHGRGDQISASQRTANVKAFCGTIQSAGYRAGVYSNKTWFTQYMNASSLTSYKIWLAQYAANVTYTATRYDMWQYTSKGSISGISGNVDMNINYN